MIGEKTENGGRKTPIGFYSRKISINLCCIIPERPTSTTWRSYFKNKRMKKDQTIWLSYDLGLKGDYPGLYAFLDAQEARECGEGLAFFKRKAEEDMAESIRQELNKYMKAAATDRVYIVFLDEKNGKLKGKFLFGKRKRALWEGYALKEGLNEEDF